MSRIRANIRVNGIVQGVGFRPFIHKEIGIWQLTGWIRNSSQGVELEVEGEEEAVEQFAAAIPERCPALRFALTLALGHITISVTRSTNDITIWFASITNALVALKASLAASIFIPFKT